MFLAFGFSGHVYFFEFVDLGLYLRRRFGSERNWNVNFRDRRNFTILKYEWPEDDWFDMFRCAELDRFGAVFRGSI